MINNFQSFFLKGHDEFIKMLLDAKSVATINNKRVRVQWRGHHTSILPSDPLTMNDLKLRLSKALSEIKLPTEEERQFCRGYIVGSESIPSPTPCEK